MSDPRLRTELPRGVVLRDPLLLASGCAGFGEEYAEITDPCEIGGVVTKAVSLEPRDGNPPPRIAETPAGLLNCIGLQNPGVVAFCTDILPVMLKGGFTFFINVVGHTSSEFAGVIKHIEEALAATGQDTSSDSNNEGITTVLAGYELDLSCPNVEHGTQFATDMELLSETVSQCRTATDALLIAKLSPNVTDIVPFARAARDACADSVTIANTWAGVSIDVASRKSRVARPSAGLSGPAIRAATLHHVWRCHRALPDLPIIGCGGVTDADSAIQYLLAGATALQIGTGMFLDPRCPYAIQQGLAGYLDAQGEQNIRAIIGTYKDS